MKSMKQPDQLNEAIRIMESETPAEVKAERELVYERLGDYTPSDTNHKVYTESEMRAAGIPIVESDDERDPLDPKNYL